MQEAQGEKRFQFLLKQVDVLQHFAPDKVDKGKK